MGMHGRGKTGSRKQRQSALPQERNARNGRKERTGKPVAVHPAPGYDLKAGRRPSSPAGRADFRPRGSRSRDNRARCSPVRNRRGDARRAVRKSRRGMAYDHGAVRAFPPLSSRTPDFTRDASGCQCRHQAGPDSIAIANRRTTTPAGPPYERASGSPVTASVAFPLSRTPARADDRSDGVGQAELPAGELSPFGGREPGRGARPPFARPRAYGGTGAARAAVSGGAPCPVRGGPSSGGGGRVAGVAGVSGALVGRPCRLSAGAGRPRCSGSSRCCPRSAGR
jgi:hypothetical protein